MVTRIIKQKNIERNLLTFLRLHIAFREDYDYSKGYNTKVLLSNGYSQELLNSVINNVEAIPFNDANKALAKFAIKAIYEPKECKKRGF